MDILKKLAKKKQKGELILARPSVGGVQSPEKFLGGVVYEALQYTIRMLPQRLRDTYNGDVRHTEDLNADGWQVMIVLTHMETRKVITAEMLIKNQRIKATTNPVKFAQELGHDIGRRLVIDVKNANKSMPMPGQAEPMPGRIEMHPDAKRLSEDIENLVKGGQVIGKVDGVPDFNPADIKVEAIDPDTLKPTPPPPKLCEICGVTDDKFPSWDDECACN